MIRHLALAALVLAHTSIAHEFIRVRALSSSKSSSAPLAAATATTSGSTVPASLNASLASVCAPSQCIQGANSLTAGVTVYTPVNGTTFRSTVLLPGTYTSASASASTANTSLLSFGTSSTQQVSLGFTGTGTVGSTYSVALAPGLTTYPSPLFQGAPSYTALSTSTNPLSNSTTIESFLLSDNMFAVLNVGGTSGSRVVAWEGVADVGNMAAGSGGVTVVGLQSSSCSTPCASGGVCMANSTCACQPGFTGATCNACSTGFFGKTCSACPAGCTTCDDGITGSGVCLDSAKNSTTAAVCNCINGVCAGSSSSSTCACNAGWAAAANGTQCAACATGYFASASGDCLACDPSCATCSGTTGTCLTCQGALAPSSTDATKCVTSSTALTNGTFVKCAARTFFNSATSTCVDCNPLCDSCFATGTSGCLACRSPLVLLNGQCVAINSKTGKCDSTGSTNAGWVFDNTKGECDALPAKCTAGAIDNFSSTSTRSQLTCSACLAGSYLSNGACVTSCPTGTTVSTDGATCDSKCSSCSLSSSYCTACAGSNQLSLNGTCITGSTCPAGYFSPSNTTSTTSSTCLACHPDCATCGPTFDTCLTCPSSRPVKSSSGTCLETCSSSEYYDNAKGACVACSGSCTTCSGASAGACLSCGPTATLKQGVCSPTTCTVVSGFGVCLSSLVTVAATSVADKAKTSTVLPWWTFLLIALAVLLLIGVVVYYWRKREQKRRRLQTQRFANDLGAKEVDLKLRALSPSVAYPPLPRAEQSDEDVPLTPRFVLEPPNGGQGHSARFKFAPPVKSVHGDAASQRWSASSYGSEAQPAAKPILRQDTGMSPPQIYPLRLARDLNRLAPPQRRHSKLREDGKLDEVEEQELRLLYTRYQTLILYRLGSGRDVEGELLCDCASE
ncbi:hypothetical protein RQP46_009601 [Phenoliferia psychrophenolica]